RSFPIPAGRHVRFRGENTVLAWGGLSVGSIRIKSNGAAYATAALNRERYAIRRRPSGSPLLRTRLSGKGAALSDWYALHGGFRGVRRGRISYPLGRIA